MDIREILFGYPSMSAKLGQAALKHSRRSIGRDCSRS